jgi:hypothetical protein
VSNVFEYLADRLGRVPLWIDFERYAAAVFAGAPDDWYGDAHRYAATLAQAHSLLRSDLLSIPVLNAFLESGTWTGSAARGESLSGALDALMSQADPARFVTDVLDALFHRFEGKVELVLELPSPSTLLALRGAVAPYDFGDMDDVAMALTSLLRQLSTRRFFALGIDCTGPDDMGDDEKEACEPLIKAARYYGWGVSVRLDGLPEAQAPERGDFDVLQIRQWSDAAAAAFSPWVAGGLTDAFWRDPTVDTPVAGTLHFGEVPADAVPELVARRMKALLA